MKLRQDPTFAASRSFAVLAKLFLGTPNYPGETLGTQEGSEPFRTSGLARILLSVEHYWLPPDRSVPIGVLMVVLRRQRVKLGDSDLMAASRAPVHAAERRGLSRLKRLSEDTVVAIAEFPKLLVVRHCALLLYG
jgi:hypothetical protein